MTSAEEHREAITNQVHLVREMRALCADDDAIWARILAERDLEHRVFLESRKATRITLDEAEAQLRNLALAAFARDPDNKAPGPGVGIRVTTNLEYDQKEALDWALKHRFAVTLDKKEFERLARELNTPPPCVTKTERPVATIASDLSKALGLPAKGPF